MAYSHSLYIQFPPCVTPGYLTAVQLIPTVLCKSLHPSVLPLTLALILRRQHTASGTVDIIEEKWRMRGRGGRREKEERRCMEEVSWEMKWVNKMRCLFPVMHELQNRLTLHWLLYIQNEVVNTHLKPCDSPSLQHLLSEWHSLCTCMHTCTHTHKQRAIRCIFSVSDLFALTVHRKKSLPTKMVDFVDTELCNSPQPAIPILFMGEAA